MLPKCFSTILLLLIHLNLQTVLAQVSEGVPCETPDQRYGICVNIDNCQPILSLLLSQQKSTDPQVRNYLKASSCGFIGRTLIVCCPQNLRSNPIFTSTTSQPSNTEAPAPAGLTLPTPPACGFSNQTNPRIVNGIPAKLGAFPWMVALGYRNSKNPQQPKWLCGGSMITDRHILTAGHCVHNRRDLYLARLGDLDLFSDDDGANPSTIALSKAKVHEDYSPVTFTNDIAILTLAEPHTNPTVWPICLPVAEPIRSRNLVKLYPTVAGWGAINFNGPSSSHLQEVVLPVVDNAQCKRAYANKTVIDDRVLCAGYARGGKDACQGDSGGPLMMWVSEGNNLRFYQIGVVSYGFRCAEVGYPGVYSRATAFIDWISRNLN